jgi:gamma-aminobutyric acid type B receptor
MIQLVINIFVLLNNVPFSFQEDDNVLHIGGIFPIGGKGGWQGGQACEPAVRLALEDVNKNSVLSGYQLKLHWNDSEVNIE